MAVFIVRCVDTGSSAVTPLFMETTDRQLNLRARSDLREAAPAQGRIVTQEPTHLPERFQLRGSNRFWVAAIQTSAAGGFDLDVFNIAFERSHPVASGDSFVLEDDGHETAFVTIGDHQR